ncbi:hypothetical protein [Paenibacillus sp. DMB20]|uniref:hypothetical protein n=1 Tax=Paenibacillus sp. DMB20 TaxID=1642570 RepID=UPI000AF8B200|nr:hypothetical protein [Paenibacillus sp. DMB20]
MFLQLLQRNGSFIHVKWFAKDHEWVPLPMVQVVTPSFLFWAGFTLIILLLSSIFHESLEKIETIRSIRNGLSRLKPHTELILRVGLGLGLLLQLVNGSYLAPEFKPDSVWVSAVLAASAAGLAHKKTLRISGVLLLLLYIHASLHYGWFHVLDYLFYPGIVYYLFVCGTAFKKTAAPVLYICTGLSLAWLAMEKLTIPKLAGSLIHDYGLPTFGFSVQDFVLISAFVELALAWAFIIGIMNRFTALMMTGIFLLTTFVFGYKEIIGHTIIHTLLILFLIEGTGERTPFKFHRSPVLRSLFVVVNFCLFLFVLMALYIRMGGH